MKNLVDYFLKFEKSSGDYKIAIDIAFYLFIVLFFLFINKADGPKMIDFNVVFCFAVNIISLLVNITITLLRISYM